MKAQETQNLEEFIMERLQVIDSMKKAERSVVFTVFERGVEFPDGHTAFIEYIKSHIRYPTSILIDGWEGTAIVHFVIEEDGKPANVSVKNKQEVPINIQGKLITLFSTMPRWKPQHSGKALKYGFEIPVTFKIVGE